MFGKLPLYFERNDGQAEKSVRYMARTGAMVVALTDREMIVTPRTGKRLRVRLSGSSGPKAVEALDRQRGVSHYTKGNDPSRWQTAVPHFSRVLWREAYRGIDVVYYGKEKAIEYDFIVAPGADPRAIEFTWEGAGDATPDSNGDLVLGGIKFERPRAFQTVDGRKVEIAASYRTKPGRRASFRIGKYDRTLPLVIDPVLTYSTYLGDSGQDIGRAIAVDSAGNAYLAGPLLNTSTVNDVDGFVAKLSPGATGLEWAVFLGGSLTDRALGIAVDSDGNVYVGGTTESTDFPTRNPYQAARGGLVDGFVTKYNTSGTMLYSTYLGGAQIDAVNAIAVDPQRNIYVAGATGSSAFPTTAGAFRTTITGVGDAFCTKFNPEGSALVYSTLFGGAGTDEVFGLALDGANNAYMTGYTTFSAFPVTANAFQKLSGGGPIDGFVVKLNPAGSSLMYASYLGGGVDDIPNSIAVDEAGHAYVAGRTNSANFPTTERAFSRTMTGAGDAFISKVSSNGSSLIYSTFLGGSGLDYASAIKVGPTGHAFVTGTIGGAGNFPTAGGPLSSNPGGTADVFISVFHPLGETLSYSTYFGGSGADEGNALVLDTSGNLFVTGRTTSTNFPVTPGVFDSTANGQDDVFAAKFSEFNYSSCIATLGSSSTSIPAAGANGNIPVTAPGGCNWNAISGAPFISVTAGATGVGPGQSTYATTANLESVPRTGSLSIAGNILQIIQPPEAMEPPYADVQAGHPFVNHISVMKSNAITSGCSATNYCPDGTTTRGQMAVFIIRALLGNDSFPFPQTPYFTDVPATHPLFKWIQKMREFGITAGCGATTYCPEDSVTRGQMAVFIFRALTGNSFAYSTTPYFTDVPASNPFFPFIQKMKEWGITTGCTATSYCVDSPTTRGQMAVFIVRAFFTPR